MKAATCGSYALMQFQHTYLALMVRSGPSSPSSLLLTLSRCCGGCRVWAAPVRRRISRSAEAFKIWGSISLPPSPFGHCLSGSPSEEGPRCLVPEALSDCGQVPWEAKGWRWPPWLHGVGRLWLWLMAWEEGCVAVLQSGEGPCEAGMWAAAIRRSSMVLCT